MLFTYYGNSCFKIEAKGTTLMVNSHPKASGMTPPRFESTIALATNTEYRTTPVYGDPYRIVGPGEYDVAGATITGIFLSPAHTAYRIDWEDLSILHLGEFASYDRSTTEDALKDIVDAVDILLVPVGDALGAKGAGDIIGTVEPRITIPMQYALKGNALKLGKLSAFIKEFGEKPQNEERLSIKRKDLPEDHHRLVALACPYETVA